MCDEYANDDYKLKRPYCTPASRVTLSQPVPLERLRFEALERHVRLLVSEAPYNSVPWVLKEAY